MTSKDKKTKKKIEKAYRTRFDEIKGSYQEYKNNPYNEGYVHRFRVNLRKMRTLLNFLKPMIGKEIYDEMNTDLRKLGKKLSPLRDLDTLLEEGDKLALAEPALIDNYAHVFRYLQKERLKLVKKHSTVKAFETFEATLAKLEVKLDDLSIDSKKLNKFVDERFDHKVSKFEKEYDQLDRTDYDQVHEVRKMAKKVRYVSTGFKKVLPEKERKATQKHAKKVQEELGHLTDAHAMIERLEAYQAKAPYQTLKDSFATLIAYYSK